MSRLESLHIPEDFTGRELVRSINHRIGLIVGATNANEGSGVHWTDAALPTAGPLFAGRTLYWDRGQGATPDEFHVCLWDGAAWAWTQLA